MNKEAIEKAHLVAEKQCHSCKLVLPLSEFHRDNSQADNHRYNCKSCIAIYMRDRASSPDNVKARKEYGKKYRSTEEYRARKKVYKARSIEKDRAKHRIRWNTRHDVEQGNIIKEPCKKCGDENSEVHHTDYEHKSHIMWLCKKCHLKEHGRYIPINENRKIKKPVDWSVVRVLSENKPGMICLLSSCDKMATNIGLCKNHAHQYWRYKRTRSVK